MFSALGSINNLITTNDMKRYVLHWESTLASYITILWILVKEMKTIFCQVKRNSHNVHIKQIYGMWEVCVKPWSTSLYVLGSTCLISDRGYVDISIFILPVQRSPLFLSSPAPCALAPLCLFFAAPPIPLWSSAGFQNKSISGLLCTVLLSINVFWCIWINHIS